MLFSDLAVCTVHLALAHSGQPSHGSKQHCDLSLPFDQRLALLPMGPWRARIRRVKSSFGVQVSFGTFGTHEFGVVRLAARGIAQSGTFVELPLPYGCLFGG